MHDSPGSQENCAEAVWVKCFVSRSRALLQPSDRRPLTSAPLTIQCVSILLPSGARKTLIYARPNVDAVADPSEKARAKLYIKDGVMNAEEDVRYVAFETAAIHKVLVDEFGFAP